MYVCMYVQGVKIKNLPVSKIKVYSLFTSYNLAVDLNVTVL